MTAPTTESNLSEVKTQSQEAQKVFPLMEKASPEELKEREIVKAPRDTENKKEQDDTIETQSKDKRGQFSFENVFTTLPQKEHVSASTEESK